MARELPHAKGAAKKTRKEKELKAKPEEEREAAHRGPSIKNEVCCPSVKVAGGQGQCKRTPESPRIGRTLKCPCSPLPPGRRVSPLKQQQALGLGDHTEPGGPAQPMGDPEAHSAPTTYLSG